MSVTRLAVLVAMYQALALGLWFLSAPLLVGVAALAYKDYRY